MKEFDLNAAKSGKPVMTRDGKKARIVCFDMKDPVKPILALVEEPRDGIDPKEQWFTEVTRQYSLSGKCDANNPQSDLVMAVTKREGWVNIYKEEISTSPMFRHAGYIYPTEEDALKDADDSITTTKIEWEE